MTGLQLTKVMRSRAAFSADQSTGSAKAFSLSSKFRDQYLWINARARYFASLRIYRLELIYAYRDLVDFD